MGASELAVRILIAVLLIMLAVILMIGIKTGFHGIGSPTVYVPIGPSTGVLAPGELGSTSTVPASMPVPRRTHTVFVTVTAAPDGG
jgi:hypothetical protein